MWSALFNDHQFSKYKLVKHLKCTNWGMYPVYIKIIIVICQPPLSPPCVISMTSSHLPADGTGKPLSRTARRTLQLVNPTLGSEVMGILRLQSVLVLRPSPVITDLGFVE